MKISFIGSGNVAWHMAQALEKANHTVVEVYSRDRKNASKLAQKLYNANTAANLDFSHSRAELFIIAVSDNALEEVAEQLRVPDRAIVVHTSGTMPLEVLSPLQNAVTGVFYPLQTFTKGKQVNFKAIPICIETSDEKTEKVLSKLAFTICENVCFVNSEDRKVLHLAAVFACNFTNHLLTISKCILEKEGLDFAILKPLIQETIEKALLKGPEVSQTGPAVRNDTKTIKNHLSLLKRHDSWREIYELITEDIQEHGRENG